MKQKKYIVIHDHQGGNFGMYRDYTPKEWKNQALEWCEQDDLEEMYELYFLNEKWSNFGPFYN